MKSKNLMMILILFSFINKIKNLDPPELGKHYPGIKCGKDNPEKEKDCTKYGTDSGMLCCFVKRSNETKICTLLNIDIAKKDTINIKDTQTFDGDEYWSCGNKSFNLSMNIFVFLILFFLD